jgi:multimeric flavodoxin WrbA
MKAPEPSATTPAGHALRVALIRGNPRPIGFTQRFTDAFRAGLRETRAEIAEIDLASRPVLPCLGCYHCWVTTPGQCVHGDAMGDYLEILRRADVWVCATPIYYYSMSALLKAFFERTFPLAQPGLTNSGLDNTRNSIRYPGEWTGKKLVTLMTGALRDPEAFRPARETFALIADSLDLELGGQLVRPESYLIDYPLSKPKTIQRIRTALVQAGRETGCTGRVTPDTQAAVALPISVDEAHFRAYSNIYWAHALELGELGLLPAEVQARVAGDVRILLREMVRCFNPQAAGRLRATLQFNFTDPDSHFHVRIDRNRCTLEPGEAANPELRISCDAATWAKVFTRAVELRSLLAQRRLRIEGDKSLFRRLDRLFPPPSS